MTKYLYINLRVFSLVLAGFALAYFQAAGQAQSSYTLPNALRAAFSYQGGPMAEGHFYTPDALSVAVMVMHRESHSTCLLVYPIQKPNDFRVIDSESMMKGPKSWDWVEVISLVLAGQTVYPTQVDPKSGDILPNDPSTGITLPLDGMSLRQIETGGGGIVYWGGRSFTWIQQE